MKKTLLTILISAFISATAQLPTYVPANGLIGWWSLNGNTNDASLNGNNGTNNGAMDTTDRFGNPNSAYFFNGSSSYISIPTSATLESPTTNLTMSAWVNLAGYSLVGQPFGPILTKSNSSANAFMYRFTVDLNGIAYYAGTNNWTTNTGAAYNFSLSQWYLLTAVLDSFNSYFYLNDSLVGTNSFTTNILNNTLPLEIGRDVPGFTEVFNGRIDDIGIWNVALTQQQITDLYLGPTVNIIEAAGESHLKIFPNPAHANFKIKSGQKITRWTLYDSLMRIAGQAQADANEIEMDCSKLNAGIYFINVLTESGEIMTEKILINGK